MPRQSYLVARPVIFFITVRHHPFFATGEASPFMTYEQAAEFLEVSKRQVRRYAADGRLPVTRLGHRTVRIARMDLERLKAKCTK